ncbi:MAG: phosphatase PAP2 family protein [Synergistaceae bacterium]|nr:phosphatase PAP2 family protein [Synergistaceae bacterium]
MDIDILLMLQEFRNGFGGIFASFLNKMTFAGELDTVPVIMAAVYWCFSKAFGTYLLMGWSGNRILNGALKVTACSYRPWIRDTRIIPYGNSIQTATGYSFPSGHTMNASTVYGGAVVRNDMPKALRISLFIVVLLVAFSRIYLGVHTPQDILCGIIFGMLVMWLTFKLMQWLEAHPDKDIIVASIGVLLAAGVAIYAAMKSYPVDYDLNGKILVDGSKMANDTYRGVGWCSGFLVGWILERRYVNFSTDEISLVTRITRLTIGLLLYYVFYLIFAQLIKKYVPAPIGSIASCFVQMFYISFIFPYLIKRYESH